MPKHVRSKYAIDSTGISEKLKSLRLDKDNDNDLPALPIIPFDINSNPSTAVMPIVVTSRTDATRTAELQSSWAGVTSAAYGLNCNAFIGVRQSALSVWEAVRTPTKFKYANCTTAAATALWTPAAGKKFRLMGGVIVFSAGLAAAATQVVNLLDSATAITLSFASYLPAAANILAVGTVIPFDLRPNGYLSTTADNVLNVTMTANCTVGGISVTVWGTEE